MKEEYRAQKKPGGGEGKDGPKAKSTVGKDGIIESHSEDERLKKRKAAPSVQDSGPKTSKGREGSAKGLERAIVPDSREIKKERKLPIKHKTSNA